MCEVHLHTRWHQCLWPDYVVLSYIIFFILNLNYTVDINLLYNSLCLGENVTITVSLIFKVLTSNILFCLTSSSEPQHFQFLVS